jgi:23S rRNA pseudouridine955/2504/2580 synthase
VSTFSPDGGWNPGDSSVEETCFEAGSDDEGRRLDRLIRIMFPEASLSRIYRSIRRGDIRLNQKRAAVDSRIKTGDRITIRKSSRLPAAGHSAAEQQDGGAPSLSSSWIVFENAHILAINKPRGVLTHGPKSLNELVRAYQAREHRESLAFRSGPLQRLDRNTTGLALFSRSLYGARRFSALLRERKVLKTYLALLDGVLASEQVWTDVLVRDKASAVSRAAQRRQDGKIARTIVTPLARTDAVTLAACRPLTGRTHQIRVQAALHGHPLAGDRKYGGSQRSFGYILHALSIHLEQEESELGFRTLFAPLPEASRRRIDALVGQGATQSALLKVPNLNRA